MHKKVLKDMTPVPDLSEYERNETLKILFNDLTCNLDPSVEGM